ncbi:MAG: aspartyl-tRNA(Asn)/glutamyl-tRNA(Gln) amidotransferase subunit A [Candidatus Tokpelaia sp. JSC085]|nr:MAG: aspartyl-tRNA(Asn)/glutamyl-tRNA(Gln) amidotransferase subunit A [Candidatus Tokpelaia sp. JSC085]
MNDLTHLTIAEARHRMKSREISAIELTEAYLTAIKNANTKINAYVAVTEDQAYAMARKSDKRFARGDEQPLEGIPIGIKDLFATFGVHTQACSRILSGFRPCYESTVTANLWADGAVMLGKLNMDEFAMGSSNETSFYGAVINPWRKQGSDVALVPGGSSGGSSAAVAAHLCSAATATDTGGSIRQPAAFTGTVGIKPTYGRCSRWGLIAFSSSMDQAGPITRDIRDSAIMLQSMASFDDKDSTSVNLPVPNYESVLGKSVKGMKIGIPKEYQVDGMPDEITFLWNKGKDWLKDAGADIIDISLPHTQYALAVYYIVASAEASSNLARYDGVRYGLRVHGQDIVEMYESTRSEGFGHEVKRRILIGTYVLSSGRYNMYYLQAQKVRSLIGHDFNQVFDKGIDAILTPTTPSAAFGLADKKEDQDPVSMYLNDIFTVPVNMTGLPGISIPAGLSKEGLPLALQLIGRRFDEEVLFQLGYVIEQASGTFSPRQWW